MSSPTGSATSDEAFSERVKKTFGNLFASITPAPTPSSLSNPLWSLTGNEVQKREWRRDKDTSDRDNNPCAASFDDFVSCARKNSKKNLKNYKKELDDDMQDLHDDDEEEDGVEKSSCGLDDWDLRGSIGLDSTLDNEEEEDAYDKVALGRENAGERWYMSDIASNNLNSASKDDFSCGIGSRRKDPRANRSAARIRLKEDEVEAAAGADIHKSPQAPCTSSGNEPVSPVAVGIKVKPILKRKEHESASKPSKRVRFDPGCVGDGSASDVKRMGDENQSEITAQVSGCLLDENVRRVPDYVQNPSNYTRYSLDSAADEMNSKSNTGASVDFLHMVKKSENSETRSEQDDAGAANLPKSITFVSKKKSDAAKADDDHIESTHVREREMKHSSMDSTVVSGFAAEEALETEVGDMEIDEPDRGTRFKKQGRQFRIKSRADEPE